MTSPANLPVPVPSSANLYPLLSKVNSPADLRHMSRAELKTLAHELRAYVLDSVSKTGGHLSSNLGTVELTVALHHVFHTPDDRLVWDVGHQTYPHKILTGRRDRMATLRQMGGISGFPQRTESEYDTFGTAHSSTSISAALGMALAAKQKGEDRYSVAIIGDGAMSAGMAFEALNNAGVEHDARLLVILNDNDMSISPPVGALNRHLARLMSGQFYAAAKNVGKSVLKGAPPLFELAKRFEQHAKGMVVPATLFEQFGFNYIGPIDGHDLDSLIPTLENIRNLQGPQFLHVVTKKGQGYKLAEADPVAYHGPGKFDPRVGLVKPATPPKQTFTHVFGQWLCDMAAQDKRLVGITPAMREGSGMVVPATLFEKFGFNYVGPIDGHDLDSLIPTLENVRKLKGPQFLHVVTKKGQGYKLAEADPVAYHGPGKFDPRVGLVKPSAPAKPSFTQVFGQWLCDMAERDPRLVGITPAMREGSGMVEFTGAFPTATTTSASPSSTP